MGNRYYIETYGCQMNVSDSELVSNQLEKIGYIVSNEIENADLIFLKLCFSRAKSTISTGLIFSIKQLKFDIGILK